MPLNSLSVALVPLFYRSVNEWRIDLQYHLTTFLLMVGTLSQITGHDERHAWESG
jgi:hypothetical protein